MDITKIKQSIPIELKDYLGDLALDLERAYALHLAIWQALHFGNLDSSSYDMGQDAVSEFLRDISERLNKLIL